MERKEPEFRYGKNWQLVELILSYTNTRFIMGAVGITKMWMIAGK